MESALLFSDDFVTIDLEDFRVLECLPVYGHSDESDLFVKT